MPPGGDRTHADDLWRQAIAHHQKSLVLRRDKAFSLRRLAQVHADKADSLASIDAAAAADARAAALGYLTEALQAPDADASAVRTAHALIELRFSGVDAMPEARQRTMRRAAHRVLARLDRRAVTRAGIRHPMPLARAAAEGALDHAEACIASLEVAVLLGELTDVDEIDRHPAFNSVRDDARFIGWRRLRFGTARWLRP